MIRCRISRIYSVAGTAEGKAVTLGPYRSVLHVCYSAWAKALWCILLNISLFIMSIPPILLNFSYFISDSCHQKRSRCFNSGYSRIFSTYLFSDFTRFSKNLCSFLNLADFSSIEYSLIIFKKIQIHSL